mgnify:CR=1 FL=1
MVLNIGEVAPEFELETSEGEMFRLSDLKGQWKVVFFFAKSGSPTCKRGCLSFKEQYELFQSLEPSVEVIGISQDTVQQHKKFKKELDLPFPLLSDQERHVAEKFGVPIHLGLFPSKSSFVIGPDNKANWPKFYKAQEIEEKWHVLVVPERQSIRSTMVREALAEGNAATSLITPSVADYINRHNLYA